MLEKYVTFFKAHERLALVFMGLVVIMFLGNKWADSSAEKARIQAAATAQIAAEAKVSADKAEQAAALTQAQYQAMVDALSRQNQVLAQAITSRDSVLGQKITEVIQPKPPTAVASELNDAYKGQASSTVTDTGLLFDPTVVQKFTVTKIERDTFQADLSDETRVASNLQTELNKSNELSGNLGTQVTSLKNEITANSDQYKADIKAVKATARASKFKYFKWGYGLGFVSGLFVGHGL
jgi:hypothetical protein